jgi:hypothetical protein
MIERDSKITTQDEKTLNRMEKNIQKDKMKAVIFAYLIQNHFFKGWK